MLKLKGALIALSMFMVVGAFLSKSAHAECKEGEERMTDTKAVFTCDTSHASLGEAWRDPSGLIWGDIVKNEDGSVRYMVQSSAYMKETGRPLPNGTLGAKEYCESIGARLPSEEEFTRLREYMGAQPGTDEGYSHHDNKILPNLSGNFFWSSSVGPYADYAYYFYGSIYDYVRDSNDAVRCVRTLGVVLFI